MPDASEPDSEHAAAPPAAKLRAPTENDRLPTLATKLHQPPVPRHLVPRDRLFDALDNGVNKRLVLLCAPAGAGKTVLLTSWIAARRLPGPSCWLSLDRDDDDASRLIADLLSALGSSGAIPVDGALAALEPPSGANTQRILPLLINGLAELQAPLVLVIDEVHELSSPQATSTIEFLVRHAPPQLRLVLASRTDPALPIERLRIAEELTELRGSDLAFTRVETSELCRRLELDLPDADVELLWARTEGWAAALRFATFSLREHADPTRFLAEFAGTDRALADYLASEVLASLALDMREFMLRTCLVEDVSASLADALTGLDGGGLMLSKLEHTGALLSRIDHEGSWYRYHPLFAELLRARLRFAHGDEVPFLHRRAARWYVANDRVLHAIRHALAAEDWELAGELIASHWLELFLRGESSATKSLMATLPEDVVEADPRLAAAFAGSRLEDGDIQGADRCLAIARRTRHSAPKDAKRSLKITLAVVELERARIAGSIQDAERLAAELSVYDDGPPNGSNGAGSALGRLALSALGTTELWAGESEGALAHLEQALALATEEHDDRVALNCLAQLAMAHLLKGELTRAEERAGRAVELADQRGWSDGPPSACAHLATAMIAYHHGAIEEAERSLHRSESATSSADMAMRHTIGVMRARIMSTAGAQPARDATLKLSAIRAGMKEQTTPAFLAVALEDAEVRALLAADEVDGARATLARTELPGCDSLLVARAAVELQDGAYDEAEKALGKVLDGEGSLARGTHPAPAVEAWLLRALAKHAAGDEAAASSALDNGLALAEKEPYRDAFLLGGAPVRDLLERQARSGTSHPALLEVLLDGVSSTAEETSLREPLTEQEQRILRYLPTMLSNAEIGAEIFVSLNTVKTHLRSIYRKLNASGRADAVERARQLHLLPAGIKRPRVMQRL